MYNRDGNYWKNVERQAVSCMRMMGEERNMYIPAFFDQQMLCNYFLYSTSTPFCSNLCYAINFLYSTVLTHNSLAGLSS